MDPEKKQTLLDQYKPLLVMYPASDLATRRPGAWWNWPTRRADYYPCPVEVFLNLIVRRDRPRKWKLFHWNPTTPWLLLKAPPPEALTKVSEIQAALQHTSPSDVALWELDISPFRSTHSSRTWDVYQVVYASNAEAKRPVCYGRCIEVDERIVLQYWYFYLYNDAPNKHEGDWEMVSLELDADESPIRAGYSSHDDGYRREWSQLEFSPEGSPLVGHPLVYVARGSHAAYFQPSEVQTQKINWPKNLPGLVADVMFAWDKISSLVPQGGVRDHTARLPTDSRTQFDEGAAVPTTVLPMPEQVSDAWWRALDCRWGSSHARVEGFVAPPPPWLQKKKWETPLQWIEELPVDPLAGN